MEMSVFNDWKGGDITIEYRELFYRKGGDIAIEYSELF